MADAPEVVAVMAALARPTEFVDPPRAFLSSEDHLRWLAEAVLLALAIDPKRDA